MTVEEKVKYLYSKFSNTTNSCIEGRKCALICVDEILKNEHDYTNTPYEENNIDYWEEVKIEIQKL